MNKDLTFDTKQTCIYNIKTNNNYKINLKEQNIIEYFLTKIKEKFQ